MKDKKFGKVAIVGLGLIGGSLAGALKKSGKVADVTGIDIDRGSIDYALRKKIIDHGYTNIGAGVSGAEVIVIATNVGDIVKTAESIIPLARKGAVITDVGSVKGRIVSKLGKLTPGHLRFVGGHPIAGTENSGVKASQPGLFRGKRFIITPTSKTDPGAVKMVSDLWRAAGAEIYEMDPRAHDRVFGFVSHLPHIVAYSLVDSILSAGDSKSLFDFAGGGLRDYTRVAASSPEMWTDIFTANRVSALKAIRKFRKSLDKIETAIKKKDAGSLRKILSKSARAKREDIK
ncbi:MAG TPA: prephenate dehydrogenase/arogenate dehydrogenase family protein [Thermodesulfobacteriota bacterium]|nr:prephenate dehydrogenase/arogenate dehydrogenase family protein [Thermodesulfobacteriota bacterium]